MVLKVDTESSEEAKPILGSDENDSAISMRIQDAYKHITLSMIAEPLRIENPDVALKLFTTAVKLRNVPLAKQCKEILDNQLNKDNALFILQRIEECQKSLQPDPFNVEPSAPPIIESDNQLEEDWGQDFIDNIRNHCLLEIDNNADYVFKQKEILNMTYENLLHLTTRNTLEVSSELIVYNAVVRWAMAECKRRTLPPQTINLKAVLRELVYAPRYGLLTKKEFMCRMFDCIKGPGRGGILGEKDVRRILKFYKDKSRGFPTDELPHSESLPRKASNEKSQTRCSGTSGNGACSVNTSCDKFVINFLTCWTAIFD